MKQEKDGNSYFIDSYAMYELAQGAENYKEYFDDVEVITSLMNLYELYYALIRDGLPLIADNFFDRFLPVCVGIEPIYIKEAALFRLQNKKMDLSYVDALGYVIAKKNGVMFLTGDDAFRKLPNVEFVK